MIILITKIIFLGGIFCHPYSINHYNSDDDHHNWILQIVHTNDMHSRFDETNIISSDCSPGEKAAGQCYGGFARVATQVRQARNSTIPALFLDAGDTYQGTPWYSLYKWEIVSKFMNILKPDVVVSYQHFDETLGNNEFVNGIKGLIPFLKSATFPIVVCNLDLSGEPEISMIVNKSIVLNIQGKKIGIIGYLTSELGVIQNIGRIIIHDEIESIKREVKKLRDNDVNILIGLGHSGYDVDKKIAAEVEGLDLIIGGHSHSFLYTGNKPSLEEPVGSYPTVVIQKSGKKVYVVQAYKFTKYLGNLLITFDVDGEIKEIIGCPILLDNKVEQASDVLKEVDKVRHNAAKVMDRPLGYTKVILNGQASICRKQECNLGNLITDSMIDYNLAKYKGTDKWTDAAVAIHNSRAIKKSIVKTPVEPITYGDVMYALPFGNIMGKTELTGWQLLNMLEHSVAELHHNHTNVRLTGQFLHLSGIKVIYNITRPVGSKVLSNHVFIRCAECKEPMYSKLQSNEIYTVLTTDFLYYGGNNYTMFKINNSTWISSGIPMEEVLATYIKKTKNFIQTKVEGRIKFYN